VEIVGYDPFAPGHFPVGVSTIEAPDQARVRVFPCEIWYPARVDGADLAPERDPGRGAAPLPGAHPLIVFSHHSGGHRRSATFLCEHLASHGYVVAALNHSEVVASELAPRQGETPPQRAARIDAVIASRVPDVRFLLDYLLSRGPGRPGGAGGSRASDGVPDGTAARGAITAIELDPERIGLVGHSFGGWTVLAAPEADPRVRAVVAMGPGGGSRPRPGILPLTLTFAWGRTVPALYLAAADDTPIPLDGVRELFGLTPEPKRMFVLQRADHQHFIDDVEAEHEAVRAMSFPGEASWIPAAMRPITELCSGEQAHLFVRGLTLGHLDAALRGSQPAEHFLDRAATELAARGVEAVAYSPVA
jgi:predicted dienelactone hydrolase